MTRKARRARQGSAACGRQLPPYVKHQACQGARESSERRLQGKMCRRRLGLRFVSVRTGGVCRRKERNGNCLKSSHFSNLFAQRGSNGPGHALYAAQAKANRTTSTMRTRSRTMTMSHEDRSAEIYQFPLRGRFAAARRREHERGEEHPATLWAGPRADNREGALNLRRANGRALRNTRAPRPRRCARGRRSPRTGRGR